MAQGYIPRLQTALVAHSYSGMHGPRRSLLFYVIFSFHAFRNNQRKSTYLITQMFSLGTLGSAGRAVGCKASSREALTLAVLFRLAAPWPESETLVFASVPRLSEFSIIFCMVVHGSSVVVVVKWSLGVVVHDEDGLSLMVSSLLESVL